MTKDKEKKWARFSRNRGLRGSAVLLAIFAVLILSMPGMIPTASNGDLNVKEDQDVAVPFGTYPGLLSNSIITSSTPYQIHFPLWPGTTTYNDISSIPNTIAGPLSNDPKIYILVDENIFGAIRNEILQYMNDLRNEGRYEPVLYYRHWVDEVEVKDLLVFGFNSQNLAGALFVGNIPVAFYEMIDNFPTRPDEHVTFPMDLFYMDVDGSWEDTDLDGAYDRHTHGNGDLQPDIFVGRLYASTVTIPGENEVSLIQNYFRKNHDYRTGNLQLNERALAFVDDPWHGESNRFADEVGRLYNPVVLYNDILGTDTTADNYRQCLANNYEWISVFAHSGQYWHAFRHRGSDEYVTSFEVSQIDPTANFYNLHACSSARYTYAINGGYLGGHYIFSESYGVCAVGHTKSGGMMYTLDFYNALAWGANIGEALMAWFNSNGWTIRPPVIPNPDDWSYGMVILGDPTLSPNTP